jgi:PTH2 family peptidyl-tRNA hydrolase
MDKYEYKLVIVIRSDLKLSAGKLAVQVAHASVACALECKKKNARWFSSWYREGQKKVVVTAANLAELKTLQRKAEQQKIITYLVSDAGLTEIPPGTVTCLGIGPGPAAKVDKVTGQLSLL